MDTETIKAADVLVGDVVCWEDEEGFDRGTRVTDLTRTCDAIACSFEDGTHEVMMPHAPIEVVRRGRRFAVEHTEVGAHVRVTVRAGVAGQRALLGTLLMRTEEWDAFSSIMEAAGAEIR